MLVGACCTSGMQEEGFLPDKLLLLLLRRVEFVDVGEFSAVIVHPEDGAAVEAGSHKTALGQEQAAQVGQVGMADASNPVCVRVRQGREQVRHLCNLALSSAQRARGVPLTVHLLPGWPQRCWRHG